MKKLIVLGLVLASVVVSSFATSLLLTASKGAAGIEYISTSNSTIEIESNRNIVTSNWNYRVNGGYYKLLGASIAASANVGFIAIGSGSSTTSSYTPIYDVVIPCDPIGAAIADGAGATQNFGLAFTNVWYQQGINGTTDQRGDTLNIQFRNRAGALDANNVLDQIYLKLEKVLFGN